MKLQSTRDKDLNHISALLFGDSGIGKTTSLKTLPHDQTLLAVCERSVLPLRGFDIPMLHIENWDDVRRLYLMLKSPDDIKDKEIKDAAKTCKFVVIDSLSEVSSMCTRHIVGVERKKLILDRSGGKTDAPDNIYQEQMDMEAWGLYRTRINNIASSFTHLKKHIIFTSLASWSRDKQDHETYRTPALSGKAAREIPAHFDLVLHMEADAEDETKRVWRTFNNGEIIAKDASGILDPFETPDWISVFKKILNGKANA